MKVYSPSQTLEWSRCPFLWATVYKKGWRSDTVDKRDLAASLGVAFGAGMEHYNNVKRILGVNYATPLVVRRAQDVAVGTLEAEWKKWVDLGLDCSVLAETGDVRDQLEHSLQFAIEKDPTPVEWKVVHVEETMPLHGNARADVVYELPTGEKVVRDYKFALSVTARYVDDRLADYGTHPQSYHYPWMHRASMFIPTLVIASPRPSMKELVVSRSTKDIDSWLVSQKVKWASMERMEEGLEGVWRSDTHKTQYGKCGLYDFCHTYEADESRLPGIGFIQVERKSHAA